MNKRFHFTAKFKDIPVHISGQEWKPVSSMEDLKKRLDTRNTYCDFEVRLTPEVVLSYLRFYARGDVLPFAPKPQHVVCLGGLGLVHHVGMKMSISEVGLELIEENEKCPSKPYSSLASSESPFSVFLEGYSHLNTHAVKAPPASEGSQPKLMG